MIVRRTFAPNVLMAPRRDCVAHFRLFVECLTLAPQNVYDAVECAWTFYRAVMCRVRLRMYF